MPTVAVNPPKTPVTEGSSGIAAATVPNVCKMPGPPAPFIPTPLPNIGKSGNSPKGYSKKVKVEGKKVAIKGATFKSMGDIASKGTGGGLISSNTEGPTSFVGPGSMNVKIEGKNVQLLSDPMLNNCGPSGNPPNAATLVGVIQGPTLVALAGDEPCPLCGKTHGDKGKLEETTDTQGDATTLTSCVDRMSAEEKRAFPNGTMLGVVRCKCSKVYAGKSSVPFARLPSGIPQAWHMRPPGSKKSKDTLQDQYANHLQSEEARDVFREKWGEMRANNIEWNQGEQQREPYYPPGTCAAQLLVLLAMDHNCRSVGLTERWYHPTDPNSRTVARYREMRMKRAKSGQKKLKSMGVNNRIRTGQFGGSDAVPPCGTCQVMLTMLLCPDETPPNCTHSAPAKGACTCSL